MTTSSAQYSGKAFPFICNGALSPQGQLKLLHFRICAIFSGTNMTFRLNSGILEYSGYLSIGDRIREVERLVTALADLKRRYKKDKTGMLSQEYISPKVVMTPQDSFYAEKESLPLEQTRGRVCSEFVMCYPPGIPVLAPGEEITDEIIQYIVYAKEKGCSMTGPEDEKIERLNVLRDR